MYLEELDLNIRYTENVFIPGNGSIKFAQFLRQYVIDHQMTAARVLDLGSGCGILALALKKSFPDMEIDAVDGNNEAVGLTGDNSEEQNLPINVFNSNMFETYKDLEFKPKFDLIVGNLPSQKYVDLKEEDLENYFNYCTDQDFNDQYYCYKTITTDSLQFLTKNGIIILMIPREEEKFNIIYNILNEKFNIEVIEADVPDKYINFIILTQKN